MSRILSLGAILIIIATACTPTQLNSYAWAGPSVAAGGGSSSSATNPHGHSEPDDVGLRRIRACESGPPDGNYTITNPTGAFRGAYQFTQSTWNGVAKRWYPELDGVDPINASRVQQDNMARALWSERGPAPWPFCGKCVADPSAPKCKSIG